MKLVLIAVVAPALLFGQAGLRAGVARVDITPPKGHAMAGYSERTHGATGVHDPLYATVLLLESGSTTAALIACDLASFTSTRIAAEARRKFGIAYTVLSMSGTHSGPAPSAKWTAFAEEK